MSGVGYTHPTWGHGRWHDELVVGGEALKTDEIDDTDFHHLHVQQVMQATWGDRVGLGVLEQIVIGPHHARGLTGVNDGFRPPGPDMTLERHAAAAAEARGHGLGLALEHARRVGHRIVDAEPPQVLLVGGERAHVDVADAADVHGVGRDRRRRRPRRSTASPPTAPRRGRGRSSGWRRRRRRPSSPARRHGGRRCSTLAEPVAPCLAAVLGDDDVGPLAADRRGDVSAQREVLDDAAVRMAEELDLGHADDGAARPLLGLACHARLVGRHRVDARLAGRDEHVGHRAAGGRPCRDRAGDAPLDVVGVGDDHRRPLPPVRELLQRRVITILGARDRQLDHRSREDDHL